VNSARTTFGMQQILSTRLTNGVPDDCFS
jgi:hypothetical protein